MNRLRAAVDTLAEVVALYAALLLCSAGLFMMVEGVSFVDALYWAGTTATSTGYGDVLPHFTSTKLLAFVLQHTSIFVIAPLVVARWIDHINKPEQDALRARLERIEELLRQ